jgi:hypothetical protein
MAAPNWWALNRRVTVSRSSSYLSPANFTDLSQLIYFSHSVDIPFYFNVSSKIKWWGEWVGNTTTQKDCGTEKCNDYPYHDECVI